MLRWKYKELERERKKIEKIFGPAEVVVQRKWSGKSRRKRSATSSKNIMANGPRSEIFVLAFRNMAAPSGKSIF